MAGAAIVVEVKVKDLASYRENVAGAGGKILDQRDMGSHGQALIVSDPDGTYCIFGPAPNMTRTTEKVAS